MTRTRRGRTPWKALGGVLGVLLLSIGVTGYVVIRHMTPAAEEQINYRLEDNTRMLQAQLAGVDRQVLRSLEPAILEKSLSELQDSVARGELTYEQIMGFYLDRIARIDQTEGGLNSFSTLNPEALAEARAADAARAAGQAGDSPLFGLGVAVKDNISTTGLPTTAGTMALAEFTPTDAPLVAQLRARGAIVLGKANMSEWANYMSSRMPSGYSSYSGQTFNPFGPGVISPSGSSSGSAVAVTANLAPVALGTETTGSLVSPAAVNSVVGFKPSHELVDGRGVVPLALSLDTVGSMGRSVADAAALLHAVVPDGAAPTPHFDAAALAGSRLGVVASGDDAVDAQVRAALEAAGATLVPLTIDHTGLNNLAVMNAEFAPNYASFAATTHAPFATLAEVVDFNRTDPQRYARYGMNFLETASQEGSRAATPETVADMLAEADTRYAGILADDGLDAIVFLDNEEALIVCMAGAPEITVPFLRGSDGTPRGVTFATARGADARALELAYSFEQHTHGRVVPEL
ncbi:amidase family protein [Corynebacterium sp. 13CS0277]|uniref:amidase family protein n=1 Tax=Corynebacterium sp. 13CS0277 TaxID=2071994 RepID=UPI001304EA69|nr:amidase family protein [Corynebacterium sp. 13CS0277]